MAPTPALIAACSVFLLLSACTPSAVTPPPTSPGTAPTPTPTASQTSPSVTPSPTWSADQAAAIAAVDEYRAAIHTIERDPAGFTEAQMTAILSKVAAGKVVAANVGSYLDLKKRGYRYDGDTSVVSTLVSNPSKESFGTEAFVTRCIDQRALRVLDSAGNEVTREELGYNVPDFNLRQYTVVRRTGSETFLVYGLAPAKGECGP